MNARAAFTTIKWSSSSTFLAGSQQRVVRVEQGRAACYWQLRCSGSGHRSVAAPPGPAATRAWLWPPRPLELQTKVILRFPKISQSWRRPLLGPSPGWKLALSHLRHYAQQTLTPQSVDVKLGCWRKGHKGQASWLAQCLIAASPSW